MLETAISIDKEAAFQTKGWSDVKLAIYMTTHLSPLHIKFFQCWRDAIQRMEIFQYADLIMYIPSSSLYHPKMIRKQLPFRNRIIIKYYKNTGYQTGAIQAMIDPFLLANDSKNNNNSSNSNNNHFQQQQQPTSWFDDYDWVIRLNPDVLIRNDTWLISTMMNDSIDAIFHDCYNRKLYPSVHNDSEYNFAVDDDENNGDHPSLSSSIPQFHTDFTAFRPRAINRTLVFSARTRTITFNSTGNQGIASIAFPITVAEHHYTGAVWNIYQSQRFVYLEGGNNSLPGNCRVEGIHSPVLHVHELVKYCPYYYNAKHAGLY
jgi:hypothetical protein